MEILQKCFLNDFNCNLNNFILKTTIGNFTIKVKKGNIECQILNEDLEEVGLLNLKKNINIKIILKENIITKIIIPIEYNFNSESSDDFEI